VVGSGFLADATAGTEGATAFLGVEGERRELRIDVLPVEGRPIRAIVRLEGVEVEEVGIEGRVVDDHEEMV
jgi:hypothetical protein